MTERLLRNKIRCKSCLDEIESVHVHDFKYCKCGKVFVDGGREYGRFGFPGGNIEDWVEFLSEYTSEPEAPRNPKNREDLLRVLLALHESGGPKIIGGKLSE